MTAAAPLRRTRSMPGRSGRTGPTGDEIGKRVALHQLQHEGVTIFVSTAYLDEAERCGRLAFMSRGHLIGLGTAAEVTRHFGQPTIEDVFIELQRRDEGVEA